MHNKIIQLIQAFFNWLKRLFTRRSQSSKTADIQNNQPKEAHIIERKHAEMQALPFRNDPSVIEKSSLSDFTQPPSTDKKLSACKVFCSFTTKSDGEFLLWAPEYAILSRHALHNEPSSDQDIEDNTL